APPTIREPLHHAHELGRKELRLVDADHLRVGLHARFDLARLVDHFGLDRLGAVAGHTRRVVPLVDARLENLHALAPQDGPAHPADEFLGLAAEHRAADDFDPTHIAPPVHPHGYRRAWPEFATWDRRNGGLGAGQGLTTKDKDRDHGPGPGPRTRTKDEDQGP